MTSENNFVFSLSLSLSLSCDAPNTTPLHPFAERGLLWGPASVQYRPSSVLRPGRESRNYSRINFMNGRAISYSRRIITKLVKTHSENKCYKLYALCSVLWQKKKKKLYTSTHKGVVVPMQVSDIINL